MQRDWKAIQRRLKALGHYQGDIDGDRGPLTDAAIISFKKSQGLRPRPYFGPVTHAALMRKIPPKPTRVSIGNGQSRKMPPWLRLAHGYRGLQEIPGRRHNADIIGWWEALKLPFQDDETPWCAGFVNAMIQESGLAIPAKYRAAALGWRWTGHGTRLDGPALGAVMSITRPGRKGSGHMTFVAGRDSRGMIMGLGGNQGNAVSINPYHPRKRDAQYHWPEGYQLPLQVGLDTLPVITSTGGELTNEA